MRHVTAFVIIERRHSIDMPLKLYVISTTIPCLLFTINIDLENCSQFSMCSQQRCLGARCEKARKKNTYCFVAFAFFVLSCTLLYFFTLNSFDIQCFYRVHSVWQNQLKHLRVWQSKQWWGLVSIALDPETGDSNETKVGVLVYVTASEYF